MNTFWLHRDQIYEQGLSLGFHVFSVGHLLWLIALALFCWLTARFYCSRDEKGRDNMRKVCGLVIVLLEYLKVIVLGLFGVHMAEFVPLHLCSAAGLGVLVYALWPRMNWLGQVFAYAFVPAALLAVIFPSTTMYPWWNFYCLHTFVIHGLILAFFVWLFVSGEVVPNYKGLWQGALFMILFSIPIYFLDGAFGVNYKLHVYRHALGRRGPGEAVGHCRPAVRASCLRAGLRPDHGARPASFLWHLCPARKAPGPPAGRFKPISIRSRSCR